jgi:hypothetical protein
MCSAALRQVGIKKVYYGCANDRFGGCGGVLAIHNEYVPPPFSFEKTGVILTTDHCYSTSPKLVYSEALEAYGGYRREEAIMLLRRFYMTENVHGARLCLTFNHHDASTSNLTDVPYQLLPQETNRKEVSRKTLVQRSPYP